MVAIHRKRIPPKGDTSACYRARSQVPVDRVVEVPAEKIVEKFVDVERIVERVVERVVRAP